MPCWPLCPRNTCFYFHISLLSVFYLDDDDDDDDEQVTLVTQTREIQEDVNYYNFLLEEDEGDRLFLDSTQLKPHRGTRTTMHHSH